MGLIEDLFGDDSILATPVHRLVLDDDNNCDNNLVPYIPPANDKESWDRFNRYHNSRGVALAATLLEMDNLKKEGVDLKSDGPYEFSKLRTALSDNETLTVEGFPEQEWCFTKDADTLFSSNDNKLRAEISKFVSENVDDGIISQLKLDSAGFITYLIDSVHNNLESNDTEMDFSYGVVQQLVIDFSDDVVDDDEKLAMYQLGVFCELQTDDDDNPCLKKIYIRTLQSYIAGDINDWNQWTEDNEEDAGRAQELREKFKKQYGPGSS